jgi:hypothetical protein
MPEDPTPEPQEPQEPSTGDPAPEPADDPKPEPADYPDGLGDAGKKALDAERKARRDAEAKLKELEPLAAKAKELEDAQKSDLEKLTEELEAAKADGASSKSELARLRAAMNHGLSPEDLELLEGVPADQVEQRAERLAARLAGTADPVVPASDNQGGGNEPSGVDTQKVLDSLPPL